MTRTPSFKRPHTRAPVRTTLRPNLLNLERPARRDSPTLYWSALVAAILVHGGLLSYLIGYERARTEHAAGELGSSASPPPVSIPVSTSLAKRDREAVPPRDDGPAGPSRDKPALRKDAPDEAPKARRLAVGTGIIGPEELLSFLEEPTKPSVFRVSLPEGGKAAMVNTQPAVAELSGGLTLPPETRLATEVGEEKTSTRDATDPAITGPVPSTIETEADDIARLAQAVPTPDESFPEDRGAAGIVPPATQQMAPSPVEPAGEASAPAEAAPQALVPNPNPQNISAADAPHPAEPVPAAVVETPLDQDASEHAAAPDAPATASQWANTDQPLPEDRGAAAIAALPAAETPAPQPEAQAAMPAPEPPAAAAAAPEPSEFPAAELHPPAAEVAAAPPQREPATVAAPAEPQQAEAEAVSEPRQAEAKAEPISEPQQAEVEADAASEPHQETSELEPQLESPKGSAPQRVDPTDRAAPTDHASLEPDAELHDTPGVRPAASVNIPLPKRRPAFASVEDVQTGIATSAVAAGADGKADDAKPGDKAGAVEAYRQKVRERLAEFKPAGGIGSGTVVVTFTLSKTGDVSSAKILHSSGETGLDESVLAAVRRAVPFPKTPPGASAAHRRFTIPFLFRS
jgi:TonB family protein